MKTLLAFAILSLASICCSTNSFAEEKAAPAATVEKGSTRYFIYHNLPLAVTGNKLTFMGTQYSEKPIPPNTKVGVGPITLTITATTTPLPDADYPKKGRQYKDLVAGK